jgi:hypothetical protein
MSHRVVTDDLEVWQRVREDAKARIAGALSIAAIVLLLIVSFTLARNPMGAAQEGQSLDSASRAIGEDRAEPAFAPSYTHCPKLQNGRWLRTEVMHRGDRERLRIECYYEEKP